jgi:hypothetical protein
MHINDNGLANANYSFSLFFDCRCPSASLDFVVEPWFMGGGKDSPAGQEFAATQSEWEAKYGVKFVTALSDLPPPAAPRLALISGRTADNPRYLTESIANGATCVYLEKPGAPTVTELEQMRKEAEAANVKVLMGYNKNGTFVNTFPPTSARVYSPSSSPFQCASMFVKHVNLPRPCPGPTLRSCPTTPTRIPRHRSASALNETPKGC